MKNEINLFKDFAKYCDNDTLTFLRDRLSQKLGGDLSDVLGWISFNANKDSQSTSHTNRVDKLLKTAYNIEQLFHWMDLMETSLEMEYKHRFETIPVSANASNN